MISARLTQEIARPRQQVFDYLTDVRKLPLWQPGVSSATGRLGTPAGSTITMDMTILGRHSVITFEVLENDGRANVRAKSVRGPLKLEYIYSLTQPGPGSTRIDIEVKINAGTVFKLAEPALQSVTQTILEADFGLLKAILEQ